MIDVCVHAEDEIHKILTSRKLILSLLVCYIQDSDNLWWESFASEFFEEDATLTLHVCLEDGPKRYCKYYRLFKCICVSCSQRQCRFELKKRLEMYIMK